MTETTIVERADIVAALRELGLGAADCAVVHSSLSSFGHVAGSATSVIEAFLEVLGQAGTLVLPTLCQKGRNRRFQTWNIRTSKSDVGRITEVFRLRPDTVRSDHATHSVAALGPLAIRITAAHRTASGRHGPWGEAAFAAASPWQKFYNLNVWIALLGVDFRVNTTVHLVEHLIVERALERASRDRRAELKARLRDWKKLGVWADYDRMKLQDDLDQRGKIRHVQCGDACLMAVRVRDMVDRALAVMEVSPREWFGPDFAEWLESAARTG